MLRSAQHDRCAPLSSRRLYSLWEDVPASMQKSLGMALPLLMNAPHFEEGGRISMHAEALGVLRDLRDARK